MDATTLRNMSNAEFLAGMVEAEIIRPTGMMSEAELALEIAAMEPLRLALADRLEAAQGKIDAAEAKRARKAAKRHRDAEKAAPGQIGDRS